jgi:S-adenosylmethionine decarboxylase proenzyme
MARMNVKVQEDESDDASAQPEQAPYKVMVSTRFLILTLTASILGAFAVGRAARIILLEGPRRALLAPLESSSMLQRPDYHEGYEARRGQLPPPVAKDGKAIPHTIYTAKNFDTARTSSSSLLIRREEDGAAYPQRTCDGGCRSKMDDKEEEEDDEEHLPAGQHLLVDMNGIDGSFLNSEERLGHAMVEVVNQASLTLLSYHCHTLVPNGVSCVGVLLESHVSFHTWPDAGVITLDLFTCGSNPLLPVVPMIERLFGVPASLKEKPKVIWAHKLRGFRKEQGPLGTWDLGTSLLSMMDMEYKKEVSIIYLLTSEHFYDLG